VLAERLGSRGGEKNNTLQNARIFVRGGYLFLKTHSFLRASLSENSSLEQIMSADKYPNHDILKLKRENIMILSFFNTQISLLGNVIRIFLSFS